MYKTNKYIFLQRNDVKEKKDAEGNIALDLTTSFMNVLEEVFSVKTKKQTLEEIKENPELAQKELERLIGNDIDGEIIVPVNRTKRKALFKYSSVVSTKYLEIIVDDNEFAIEILEYINKKIMNPSGKINKHFIPILSYDSVSEYYCNKIFPLLNEFERKLKNLLFLIYTSRFRESFFEETIPKEVQKQSKEIIKAKKKEREKILQQSMYSLDFHAMETILFEERWTKHDSKLLNKFLKRNKDLTKLDDKELRTNFENFQPKSDWERLFSNKKISKDFSDIIHNIGKLRNLVAHNRLFNKEHYETLKHLLEIAIPDIDKAIIITETEDFQKINKEYEEEMMERLFDVVSKVMEQYNDIFSSVSKQITNGFASITKMVTDTSLSKIRKKISEINFSELISAELKIEKEKQLSEQTKTLKVSSNKKIDNNS